MPELGKDNKICLFFTLYLIGESKIMDIHKMICFPFILLMPTHLVSQWSLLSMTWRLETSMFYETDLVPRIFPHTTLGIPTSSLKSGTLCEIGFIKDNRLEMFYRMQGMKRIDLGMV